MQSDSTRLHLGASLDHIPCACVTFYRIADTHGDYLRRQSTLSQLEHIIVLTVNNIKSRSLFTLGCSDEDLQS